jgi:RecA-family ATPase
MTENPHDAERLDDLDDLEGLPLEEEEPLDDLPLEEPLPAPPPTKARKAKGPKPPKTPDLNDRLRAGADLDVTAQLLAAEARASTNGTSARAVHDTEHDGLEVFDGPQVEINPDGFDEGDPTTPFTSMAARGEVQAAQWDARVALSTAEWFSTAPAARRWLLRDSRRPKADGVLPLGKVGGIIAAGGGGKTMILVQLAIAVATGGKWLDTFSVAPEGRGRVLMLLGEEDAEEVHRRMYNASRDGGPVPEPGTIVVLPLAGTACAMLEGDELRNPRETSFYTWLLAYVARERFSLIIADPLSRFAGLEAETSNAIGTVFMSMLERLAMSNGATLLYSHHVNKLSRGEGAKVTGASGRGSSSIFDGARWECSLGAADLTKKIKDPDARERLGEVVTLAFTKSNYSKKPEPLTLRRSDGGRLVPLDDVDQATVDTVDPDAPAKAATRRAQAETDREEKDQKAREAQSARKATDEAERRVQDEADDDAAREARRANPAMNVGALTAVVRKARACGQGRAHDAVRRTRAPP